MIIKQKERFPKSCALQYEDGWWITFQALDKRLIKSHGPYKTKNMAEPDRIYLNNRITQLATTKQERTFTS
jgi:hypothetical protein